MGSTPGPARINHSPKWDRPDPIWPFGLVSPSVSFSDNPSAYASDSPSVYASDSASDSPSDTSRL